MKKRLLSALTLVFTIVSYAQTTRFVYDTYVNPDSINLVTLKNEKTFLDVKGNKSLFISEKRLVKDSLQANFKPEDKKEVKKEDKSKLKGGTKNMFEPSFFEYFVVKDLADKKVSYHEKIADREIYYQEDRPLNWKISNETDQFLGYNIQKATVNFGGRLWTAWFTKDIPISDGPYKFYGLPGLIVKLEDDKADYRFELLKKVNLPNSFDEMLSLNNKQTTRIEFLGDKNALLIEIGKSKKLDPSLGFDQAGKRGGMHNGGMNRGGNGMPGGEMGGRPDGMGGFPPMMSSGGAAGFSFGNAGIQNPIEVNE